MKNTMRGCMALAAFAAIALSAPPVPAADLPGQETYIVKAGDTLSLIARRVFGAPGRWRELLALNPQVTDANKIYPGDSLRIPVLAAIAPAAGTVSGAGAAGIPVADAGSGLPAAGTGAGPDAAEIAAGRAAAEAAAEAEAIARLPVEFVRSAGVVNAGVHRMAGAIVDGLPALAIIATEDDRVLVATHDTALVNAALEPGALYTVVRADRRVFHPLTGCYLGWLTRVLGTAEVVCADARTSTVMFRGMRDSAGVGDYLVPHDPADTLTENRLGGKARKACIPFGPGDGVIVAFDEDQPIGVEQEYAYLDQGMTDGVTPGSRFAIYRETAPAGRLHVGELQVLRAGESTSTALITTSNREVQVGDLLRAR